MRFPSIQEGLLVGLLLAGAVLLPRPVLGQSAPPLVAAEWFIGADPGPGLATALPIASGQDVDQLVELDISGLDPGFHVVSFRFRDDQGRWGPAGHKLFIVSDFASAQPASDIVALEAFFDADPGPGMGVPLSMTAGTAVTTEDDLDLGSLAPGVHAFFVRGRTAEGRWGPTSRQLFTVIQAPEPNPGAADIVAAEAFFDADPGPGQGMPLTVTPTGVVVDFSGTLLAEGLAPGFHKVHTRVKDADGRWSQAEQQPFAIVVPPVMDLSIETIVAAEYFIGTDDPGVGNGVSMDVIPGSPYLMLGEDDLAGLAPGEHIVSVRVRGVNGGWRPVRSMAFTVEPVECAVPDVTLLHSATGATVEFAAVVTNAVDTVSYAWDFDNDGVVDATAADTTYTYPGVDQPVIATVVVDNGGGCTASDQVALFHDPDNVGVALTYSGSLQLCFGESVTLIAGAGTNHVWNTGATGPELEVTGAGNFLCTWTDASGATVVSQPMVVAYDPVSPYVVVPGVGGAGIDFPEGFTLEDQILWPDGTNGTYVTGLAPGVYEVAVDNGICSVATTFEVPGEADGDDALAVEYFWDADPGPGLGSALGAMEVGADGYFDVDRTGLEAGFHKLGVRVRASDGRWSQTRWSNWYETGEAPEPPLPAEDLVLGEYFYGDDPGVGAATAFALDAFGTEVTQDFEVPAPTDYPGGTAILSVRMKTAPGQWGHTKTAEITVCDAPEPPVLAASMLELCSGEATVLEATEVSGLTYAWTGPDGATSTGPTWSLTAPVAGEYSVSAESDPGCFSLPSTVTVEIVEDVPVLVIDAPVSVCGTQGSVAMSVTYDPTWSYDWTVTGTDGLSGQGSSTVYWNASTATDPVVAQVQVANVCDTTLSTQAIVAVGCVPGCTAPTACNYNPAANEDDGSCEYPNPGEDCLECTEDVDEDGVCDAYDPCVGEYSACGVCNGPEIDTDGDGVPDCNEVGGCMDATACNYEAEATDDDGSCCYGACLTATVTGGGPVQVIGFSGEVLEALPVSNGQVSACLTTSCVGLRLLGSGSMEWTLTGTVEASGIAQSGEVFPVIWGGETACDGLPSDAAVSAVTSPEAEYAPGEAVVVTYTLTNAGYSEWPGGWTETVRILNGTGSFGVEVGQQVRTESLAAGGSAQLTATVSLPDPVSFGSSGRFEVTVTPVAGVEEYLGQDDNNTAVEETPWSVGSSLTWSGNFNPLEEGTSRTMTLYRNGSVTSPLEVALSSDDAGLQVPGTVYFPTAATSRTVLVQAVDDTLLVGDRTATILATATGYPDAELVLDIEEDELPSLTIALDADSLVEGESTGFTITTNLVTSEDVTVYFNWGSPQQLSGPVTVVIPAGATSASGEVTAVQNGLPELDADYAVLAGASGLADASATLHVQDDDVPDLSLTLTLDTVSEGAGPSTVYATLARGADFADFSLSVQLTASQPNQIYFPTSLQFAAGLLEQTFNVGVVDNALDDGTRAITLSAAVSFSSCGCLAEPESMGYAEAVLVLTDNDGPALSLAVEPSVVAEGVTEAGILTVSRNSSTEVALDVALTVSDTAEAVVPATVEIPVGASSVDVAFSTLNDGEVDGTQQVTFTASAPGFDPGQAWVLVTDENRPDLEWVSATVAADTIVPGELLVVSGSLTNTGFSTMPTGWSWSVIRSDDDQLGPGDETWFSDVWTTPVPVGSTAQISGAFAVPEQPGSGYLFLQANALGSPSELTYTNNAIGTGALEVTSPYLPTAVVDAEYFEGGSTVPIHGQVLSPSGQPVVGTEVEVYVLNGPYRRELFATTDGQGQYTVDFVPYASERGTYDVGAGYPGLGEESVQDRFDLLGLELLGETYLSWNLLTGDTLEGELTFTNVTTVDLTGLSLAQSDGWEGFELMFDAVPDVAAGETVTVAYTAVATAATEGTQFFEFQVEAMSDQGLAESWNSYVFIQDPFGVLSADPGEIIVTVSDQLGSKVVEFDITNEGAGPTGPMTLLLPDGDWISSLTPTTLPSLASGETTTVSLMFIASPSVPLQYTIDGQCALNVENGEGVLLPFEFTRVSEAFGSLEITAVNQFTVFAADSPPLQGADVRVETYFGGELLAEGVTGSDGRFVVDSIQEGPIRVTVTKSQHADAVLEVNLNAGVLNAFDAFLSYQPVTYWWNVEEIEIEDTYTITLESTFITSVPMPVLRIECPTDSLPALVGDELYVFNVTLINDGLIALEETELMLPTDSEYEFITGYEPSPLPALSSIDVPVIMRRIDAWAPVGQGSDDVRIAAAFASHGVAIDPGSLSNVVSNLSVSSVVCDIPFAAAEGLYECYLGESLISQALALLGYFQGRYCQSEAGTTIQWTGGSGAPYYSGGGGSYTADGTVGSFEESGGCLNSCQANILKELANYVLPDKFKLPSTAAGQVAKYVVKYLMKQFTKKFTKAVDTTVKVMKALKKCYKDYVQSPSSSGGGGGNSLGRTLDPDVDYTAELDSFAIADFGQIFGSSLAIQFEMVYFEEYYVRGDSANIDSAMSAALDGALGDSIQSLFPEFGSQADTTEFDFDVTLLQSLAQNYRMSHVAKLVYGNRAEMVLDTLMLYEGFEDLYADIFEYVVLEDSIPSFVVDSLTEVYSEFEWGPVALGGMFDAWNSIVEEGEGSDFDWGRYQKMGVILEWVNFYAISRGYSDWTDLFAESSDTFGVEYEAIEESQESATCAGVSLQLSQQLAMTREAFEGTFGISNGYTEEFVDSLSVEVIVYDPDGVPRNDLFEIQVVDLDNLNSIDGDGVVYPSSEGTATFLIIPEPGAAPTEPVVYGFGGTVSYYDPIDGVQLTYPLEPAYLTVEPSPNLNLDYFIDRVVYGDDALTEPVEPMLPAELSVMIHNSGYGEANSVTIASAQPEIVDNEMGLAIAFEIIGSAFEGEPANLGILNVDFGDIPSFESRIGSWFLTSTLLGYFTDLSADVVHNDSYGNPNLSLIESVEFHEMIRRVRNPFWDDGRDDFLVNGEPDAFAIPDALYFSQGDSIAQVTCAVEYGIGALDGATATSTLEVTGPVQGWTYLNGPSPGGDFYDLISVTRSDGSEVPIQNAWVTRTTVPMSGDPVHEPVLHFLDLLDSMQTETYTLLWEADFDAELKILAFEGIPAELEDIQFEQVDSVVVEFDRPIIASTFDADDIQVWNQGELIDASAAVMTALDETRYLIDLSAVTTGDGFFKLVVATIGIDDITGEPGLLGEERSWVQFIGYPYVMELFDAFEEFWGSGETFYVTESMPHVDLIFNVPLDQPTLDLQDFQLKQNGQTLAEFLPEAQDLTNRLQRLDNFDAAMVDDGVYGLCVDLAGLSSQEGLTGDTIQLIEVVRDRALPTLLSVEPVLEGGLDEQHYTGLDFVFDEPVEGLDSTMFTLMSTLDTLDFSVSPQGEGASWRLSGWGLGSYPEATYTVSFTAADPASDLAGLTLVADTSWTWEVVRSSDLMASLDNLSPDLGYSSSDRVTYGQVFTAAYSVNGYADHVYLEQRLGDVYEVVAQDSNLVQGAYTMDFSIATDGAAEFRFRTVSLAGIETTEDWTAFFDPVPLQADWSVVTDGGFGAASDPTDVVELAFAEPYLGGTNFQPLLSLTRNGFPVPLGAIAIETPDTLTLRVADLIAAHTLAGQYELTCNLQGVMKRSSGRLGNSMPSIQWSVESTNAAPTADAGDDVAANGPGDYTLDGTGSADADGDALTYTWLAPGLTLSDASVASPTVTIDESTPAGEYEVVLVVSDGALTSTDVVMVTVSIDCDDLDEDGLCDDVDNCSDVSACNYADPANGACETLDVCGVCGGPGATFDCGCTDLPAGDCDCDGNQLDALGVCGGPCAEDADGDGVCDDVDDCVGDFDACGVCNGPGAIYECGCADIPAGDCDCDGNQLDALGACGGDCAADADADGICDDVDDCVGELDACGVCNGPGEIYECGCSDIPAGDCDCDGNQLDALGVCGGSCVADVDADGVCDDVDDCVGELDSCGVCNGPGAVYECGCSDIPEGDCDCSGTQPDAIGECGGDCPFDANGNGICDDAEVAGCTYASACNYDQAATMDDGSCEMPVPGYDCDGNPIDPSDGTPGCTYPDAENYNPLATVDDGSCTLSGGSNLCPTDLNGDGITATGDLLLLLGVFGLPCTNEGCTDPDYLEYDASATSDDGSCQTLIVLGCMNPDYLEYDAAATIDNGACATVRISGCTDESFFEYSALANDDDGSCVTEIVPGCTYPEFSNYNPDANVDDGSCTGLLISGCMDTDACNYNASATVEDGSCLVVCFECETVLIDDDFDGYDPAIPLSLQSSAWTTWSGIPGSAEDPFVIFDDIDGAVLLQLPNDLVLPIGAVSGRYMVQYSVIPGTSFYMNVQGSLSTGVEWSLEQRAFPNGDWYVQSFLSGDSVFIPGYTPGEEMLQTFIFDLDADVVEMYLGPDLVVSAGYPGNLGSINFYPASFDGFDANAVYFLDDVKVCSAAAVQYGCTNSLYAEYDPQADLEDGSCSTLVVGCSDPSATNYVATVTTDNGSCIYPVTFQVDLSNYPDSLGQVFLNGSWLGWCGSCAPMSDPDGDGVFAVTIDVPEGLNEYIFTMDGWSIVEEVYLQPVCSGDPNGDGYFNRMIDVVGPEILSPVCWGECGPCAGGE